MTEQASAEATEPTETEVEPDQQDQVEDQPKGEVEDQAEEQPTSRREAKYRRELRETQAERDQLVERVEQLQKQEAERIAGKHLAKPAALWAAGVELADLLDEQGHLDPDRVTEAAGRAADELGVAAPAKTPKPDPTQGGKGSLPSRDTWTDAFRPHSYYRPDLTR